MAQRKLFRLDACDWEALAENILSQGYGQIPHVLDSSHCDALVSQYHDDRRFRKRIVMERHGFGKGEYSYFSYPLPKVVAQLRTDLYRRLAPVANRMVALLNRRIAYPSRLKAFQDECRRAGQTRPTPLILRYDTGGFNCLHRDLYGNSVFPLQAMIALNQKKRDYRGGEFVLVENRPRQQAQALVLDPSQGDLIIFPVTDRPVQGKRGMIRASMRHGVSPVLAGQRWVLGIIFHDAL